MILPSQETVLLPGWKNKREDREGLQGRLGEVARALPDRKHSSADPGGGPSEPLEPESICPEYPASSRLVKKDLEIPVPRTLREGKVPSP